MVLNIISIPSNITILFIVERQMNDQHLTNLKRVLTTHKGSLNGNYKKILSQDDIDYITSLYPKYHILSDALTSFINDGYRECQLCSCIISWKSKSTVTCKPCGQIKRKAATAKSNMEKYGVEHNIRRKDIQDRIKQTNREKYGCDYAIGSDIVKQRIVESHDGVHPSQRQEVKDKIRDTKIERYCGLMTPDMIAKQHETKIDRYGTINTSSLDQVKEKVRQTNITRYGGHSSKDPTVIQKRTDTNMAKYGTASPSSSEVVKDKIKQTNIERYGSTTILSTQIVKDKRTESKLNFIISLYKDLLDIDLDIDDARKISLSRHKQYSTDFLQAYYDYVKSEYVDNANIDILKTEFCTSVFYNRLRDMGHQVESSKSILETDLFERVKNITSDEIQTSVRGVLPNGYELDVYIPTKRIAIEFNGFYWHSDKFKDKMYHQNKTKMCNDLGITLIHVWEHLYIDLIKRDVYMNILRSKLQMNSNRVYARRCYIKQVDKRAEIEFLNSYHLQGFIGSKICYGLYCNETDELLTLCSFGKSRFDKKYDWELLRNCTKPNTTVVGGLSKLIKHFKNINDVCDIVCYSDASISVNKGGDMTTPNYSWINNKGVILNRYATMKHKLHNVLGECFNPQLSERENMTANRFYRLYDSGNYKAVL